MRMVYNNKVNDPSCLGGIAPGTKVVVQRTEDSRGFIDDAVFNGIFNEPSGEKFIEYDIMHRGRIVKKKISVTHYKWDLAIYFPPRVPNGV